MAFHILLELLLPECLPRFGIVGVFAARMLVPETAVNKYNGLVLWQNNVGTAGKVPSVQTKSVAHPV